MRVILYKSEIELVGSFNVVARNREFLTVICIGCVNIDITVIFCRSKDSGSDIGRFNFPYIIDVVITLSCRAVRSVIGPRCCFIKTHRTITDTVDQFVIVLIAIQMVKGIVSATCVFARSIVHTNQVVDQDKVVTRDAVTLWQRDNKE